METITKGPLLREGNLLAISELIHRRHGQGTYRHANGKVHQGYYQNGQREGPGKLVDFDGVYEGNFSGGKMEGHGIFTFKNGDWYEGEFKNNFFHGIGVMMEKTSKYEGEWVQGIRCGHGKWVTNNGDVYEGMFENNLMNGKGTYLWANGNTYTGYFKDGKPHGKGCFTFLDTGETIVGKGLYCLQSKILQVNFVKAILRLGLTGLLTPPVSQLLE